MSKILTLSCLLIFQLCVSMLSHAEEISLQSSYKISSIWQSGWIAEVSVKNTSTQSIESWQLEFRIPNGQNLFSLWNGQFITTDQKVTVKNETWNGFLQPGQTISIGVQINNLNHEEPKLLNVSAKGFTKGNSTPVPTPEQLSLALQTDAKIDSDWGSGKQISILISNPTNSNVNRWNLEFDLAQGAILSSLWNGVFKVVGNHVTVTNPTWFGGGNIAPGGSVNIGMTVKYSGQDSPVVNVKATGNPSDAPVQLPAAPVLDAILNDDRDENYFVRWHSVATATGYILEHSTTSNFTSSTIVLNGNVLEKQFQGQSKGTHYYRVKAVNQAGSGPYSQVRSVIVENPQPLGTPTLQKIQNDDLNGSYTVSWTAVDNAIGYLLEESKDVNFASSFVVYDGPDTHKDFFAKANGQFFYRVKAKNSSTTGIASNVESVIVNIPVQSANRKVIGYYPNWAIYRSPAFYPKDINASLVTHINYAFSKVDTAGNIILIDSWADTDYRSDWNAQNPYWGNFKQLSDLKKANPNLKTLISIGGWTLSDTFSAMAANSASRSNFAQKCVEFCKKYDFDGVDIDWEYPGFAEHSGRPEDKQNFTLLLKEVNAALKAQNPPLLLTIAAPAGPSHYANIEISKIIPYLDWINLMTYDFHGPWPGEVLTNHLAPLMPTAFGDSLLNVDSAVQHYLSQGIPSQKLVVGVPLYGKSYANAGSTPTGLYSTFSGPGYGTTSEEGVVFFSDIKRRLLQTYTYYWDDKALGAYLYNHTTRDFISYDSEDSFVLKGQYVKNNNLGGIMVWELGLDTFPVFDAMKSINNALRD